MTSRGIAELEKRVVRNLPRAIVEVFGVDPTRYLISVQEVRLSTDRQSLSASLDLRFLPGRKFCCRELGCHLPSYDADLVAEVARRLAKRVGLPASLKLGVDRVNMLVDGAEFLTLAELEARTQTDDDRRAEEIVREYEERQRHRR